MDKHNRRRVSFNQVAVLYDQVRPGYPHALIEDVIELSCIPAGGRILEIGCGTGKATLPFARQGYSIHCVELGANLAAVAQQNLASYPNVKVLIGAFETWVNQEEFDLVISATAFHWIDPAVGYPKAAGMLKPNGTIALFWNKPVQTEISADFFQAVQAVYERIVPEMAQKSSGLTHPAEISTPVKDELDNSGLFGEVAIRKYNWNSTYSAVDYINLLNTYSDHRILDDLTREKLFLEITELINRQFAGQITKEYLALLYLAQRK